MPKIEPGTRAAGNRSARNFIAKNDRAILPLAIFAAFDRNLPYFQGIYPFEYAAAPFFDGDSWALAVLGISHLNRK